MRIERIGDAVLYNADCLEVLPTLGKVDAVVTDPPYSERTHAGHDASAKGHGGAGNDAAHRSTLGYAALTAGRAQNVAERFCDVCDGWVVWMTDHSLAPVIMAALELRGRYVFAQLPFFAPGSRVRLSGDGPSSWTDWIVVSRTAKQSRWGTLPGGYVAGPGWDDKQHMGGKPTLLMSRLVGDYSRPNSLVLDPFMGSGTTGVACAQLGRKFIGIEIEPKYFEIACERIENAYRQAQMFPPEPAQPKPEQQELLA